MSGNHVHLSPISIGITVSIVLLTLFFINVGGAKLAASQNENRQLWGAALGNFA